MTMQDEYDTQGARASLIALDKEGIEENGIMPLNRLMTTSSKLLQSFKISASEAPKLWRLVKRQATEDMFEEALFAIRGILKDKDLPPIKHIPDVSPSRFKYLRQSVTLTGLNSTAFDDVARATQEIYGQFDRELEDGTLITWDVNGSDDAQGPELIVSNHYFTPVSDSGGAKNMAFGLGIDPHGVLASMLGSGKGPSVFVHMEESQMQYYNSYVKSEGKREFEECEPQRFRIGDIVEIQISFIAVPLKKDCTKTDCCKMAMVLRSMALLDSRFATAARSKQVVTTRVPTMLVVKCKAGYKKKTGKEGSVLFDETAESNVQHCAIKALGLADKSMQLD